MKNHFIPLCLSIFFLTHVCFSGEGCIERERVALLEFKKGLIDSSNRLFDWVPHSSRCCSWTGVVCHNLTYHVLELHLANISPQEYLGPNDKLKFFPELDYERYDTYSRKLALRGNVSSSLLQLKHLSILDLSFNVFGVTIPKFLGSLRSLRYLNLSGARFYGVIPPQLGNLSNLEYLNLGKNFLEVENLDWLTRLSSLKFLDLSRVDLSASVEWLKLVNSIPSLIELHLSSCSLQSFSPGSLSSVNLSSLAVIDVSNNYFGGHIPNGLQNMSSFLRELRLSSNNFNSSIPNWLYGLTNLKLLHLNSNKLRGQISRGLGNMTSLISLDLSYNDDIQFEKGIPNPFKNFCNLMSLSLSYVKIDQEINDVLAILSLCASSVLEHLVLSNCQLSSHLTDDLAHFKNLVIFDISNNLITGPISLSFANLNKLELIDISGNRLEGEVSQHHFTNLTRLVYFLANEMKYKNISLRVSSNWIPPLQLRYLALPSWDIGSQFPKWIHLLKHLRYLDLSDSNISSPIPFWFWDLLPNYNYLNFSHNQMQGSIPNILFSNERLPIVDLSSNNFSGVVPHFSSNLRALDLSHNSFSGSLSNFLCYKMNEEKFMAVLNLEGNFLHGDIPDCWWSWRNLGIIKLSDNFFTRNIPYSIGALSYLQSLHLHNNNLSGEIPFSIRNCTQLFLLDISKNNLEGNIGKWVGAGFSQLRILNLHANKFEGYLQELCHLVSLQVLDISQNRFFGTIPNCFGKFNAMATRTDSSGSLYAIARYIGEREVSTLLLMKGGVMEYSTNLGFVRSIDISNNNISGEIPSEITNLTELLSLNLSHNALTGKIPNNIGEMKGLEVIDLSHNQFYGGIPQSMVALTFLGTLDLSYNNLSGRIPSGTQLQSFNASSFMGNHLCGLPLITNCTLDKAQPESHIKEEDNGGDEVDVWLYGNMAFGFVLGFWIVIGSLVFIKRWRHFYFRSVYYVIEVIWWNLIGRFH